MDEAIAAEEIVAPGTVVGEYVVEDRLGIGGFGAVYRGHHPVIGKAAAIKVLRREFSHNREVVERFVAEARSVNQIRHRNIIDIFSFGALPDGRQFFVMELLEGLTLEALIERKGRLSVSETMAIVRPLARALAAAHQNAIAHRDLKPENVFVTFDDDGRPIPKLLDFGIAKLLGNTAGRSKTQSGMAMGSPLYMSPEQVHGTSVDHRTDVYSLGAVVFQMLTGAPPFDGDTAMAVMIKHVTVPPPPPTSVLPTLPPAFDAAIGRMLAKSADERPQNVPDALSALEEAATTAGWRAEDTSGRFDAVTRIAPSTKPTLALPAQSTPSFISSATVVAPSLPVRAEAPPRSPLPWVFAGVVAVAAVGIGAFVALRNEAPAPAQTNAAATEPGVSATPTAEATAKESVTVERAPPIAASVRVVLRSNPPGAEIVGQDFVGRAGEPIPVARSTAEIVLKVKKPGYRVEEVKIVPSADVDRDVTLVVPPASTWSQKF